MPIGVRLWYNLGTDDNGFFCDRKESTYADYEERAYRRIIFWGGLAYCAILAPLYLLICTFIKYKFRVSVIQKLLYPILCALLFILLTGFIMMIFGGTSFFAPEAQLFYAFFAASGIVFGIGYGFIQTLTKPSAKAVMK
jgi:hypothetical protein